MSRTYIHRYKVLVGASKGLISNGQQIGFQDYPNQFKIEEFTHEKIFSVRKDKMDKGFSEGIWVDELKSPLYRPLPVQGGYRPKVEITDEGVNYDDVYIDLCVPFDRYNNEIKQGDILMIASKNEVRRVKVTKIAKKPYMASYGIMNRKLTVHDELEDQTLTINDPRATVKV